MCVNPAVEFQSMKEDAIEEYKKEQEASAQAAFKKKMDRAIKHLESFGDTRRNRVNLLIGETGCGKSTLARYFFGLPQAKPSYSGDHGTTSLVKLEDNRPNGNDLPVVDSIGVDLHLKTIVLLLACCLYHGWIPAAITLVSTCRLVRIVNAAEIFCRHSGLLQSRAGKINWANFSKDVFYNEFNPNNHRVAFGALVEALQEPRRNHEFVNVLGPPQYVGALPTIEQFDFFDNFQSTLKAMTLSSFEESDPMGYRALVVYIAQALVKRVEYDGNDMGFIEANQSNVV